MAALSSNIEPLDVNNYGVWSKRMRFFLESQGLWDAAQGKEGDQEKVNKARAILGMHVKDHHLDTVASAKSAHAAWTALE
jgi:hypothetical protein